MKESFIQLQRLARSFDDAARAALGQRQEERMLRFIDQLGPVALPLCLRELGAGEARAAWAARLLAHLAKRHHERVVAALHQLLQSPAQPAEPQLHAVALLVELVTADHTKPQAISIESLAEQLQHAQDAAAIAGAFLDQLDDDELLAMLDAFSLRAPRKALALLDEFLLRDQLSEDCRRAMRHLAAPLRVRGRSSRLPSCRAARPIDVRIGRHPSGRSLVVALRGGARRALCVLMSREGLLLDALYSSTLPLASIEREILIPLAAEGYIIAAAPPAEGAATVASASLATRRAGRPLPPAYFLGRDLLGLYDEHMLLAHRQLETAHEALLARGIELLSRGEALRAQPVLERYSAACPSDAEGAAALAACLLVQGQHSAATPHLRRAVSLEPTEPAHRWNLAAAAHKEARLGGCYLALCEFLRLSHRAHEQTAEHRERRAMAHAVVREYERLARLEHCGAAPCSVAHADEHVHRARDAHRAGRVDEAEHALRAALALVPEHATAWSQLAAARLSAGDVEAASSAAERALVLRPTDALAHRVCLELASLVSGEGTAPTAGPAHG